MVYATTIPDFKRTVRRLIRRSRGIEDDSFGSASYSMTTKDRKTLQKTKSTDSILGPSRKAIQKSRSSDSILGPTRKTISGTRSSDSILGP